MRRPVIGICTALERARWTVWENEAFLLSRAYVDAVQAAGGLAYMIPPDSATAEDPDAALDPLDALVLAGGADVDPAAYGAEPHRRTTGTRPERDAAEIPLARRARARGALARDEVAPPPGGRPARRRAGRERLERARRPRRGDRGAARALGARRAVASGGRRALGRRRDAGERGGRGRRPRRGGLTRRRPAPRRGAARR